MTRPRLRAVPDIHTVDATPDTPTPRWLVRVWYATEDTPTDDLLAEGVVAGLEAAERYAKSTYAAQRDRAGYVWVQALLGHYDPTGRWVHSAHHRATFTRGMLGAWMPPRR